MWICVKVTCSSGLQVLKICEILKLTTVCHNYLDVGSSNNVNNHRKQKMIHIKISLCCSCDKNTGNLNETAS